MTVGAITRTQAAIDAGLNRFATGGTPCTAFVTAAGGFGNSHQTAMGLVEDEAMAALVHGETDQTRQQNRAEVAQKSSWKINYLTRAI